jgi:hypothetical protein
MPESLQKNIADILKNQHNRITERVKASRQKAVKLIIKGVYEDDGFIKQV